MLVITGSLARPSKTLMYALQSQVNAWPCLCQIFSEAGIGFGLLQMHHLLRSRRFNLLIPEKIPSLIREHLILKNRNGAIQSSGRRSGWLAVISWRLLLLTWSLTTALWNKRSVETCLRHQTLAYLWRCPPIFVYPRRLKRTTSPASGFCCRDQKKKTHTRWATLAKNTGIQKYPQLWKSAETFNLMGEARSSEPRNTGDVVSFLPNCFKFKTLCLFGKETQAINK